MTGHDAMDTGSDRARHGRHHELAGTPRPGRRALVRLAAWCLALALLASPVIAVLTGALASERWQLRHLELHAPLQRTSAAQVQAVVRAHSGPGFFALPLAELRQALQQLPWVRSVQVRKRWPDTVIVHLHEHQPYAVWHNDAVVTRAGERVPVPTLAGLEQLPRLSGPPERIIEVVNFHARSVARSAGTPLRIAAVHLSARGSWVLESHDGSRILLGRNQAEERLTRFADTIPALLARHPDEYLQHADLRYPNGYALTWQPRPLPAPDAGATDPAADEPGRPPTAVRPEDSST